MQKVCKFNSLFRCTLSPRFTDHVYHPTDDEQEPEDPENPSQDFDAENDKEEKYDNRDRAQADKYTFESVHVMLCLFTSLQFLNQTGGPDSVPLLLYAENLIVHLKSSLKRRIKNKASIYMVIFVG